MRTRRDAVRSVWLPAAVLVALVAGAGVLQVRVRSASRSDIDAEFRTRTEVAADYLGAVVDDAFDRHAAVAETLLSGLRPGADELARAAAATRAKAAVLLDGDGSVLARHGPGPAAVADPVPGAANALADGRAVSGALRAPSGGPPAVALSSAFDVVGGRRVLGVVVDPRRTPIVDHLAQSFPLAGQAAVLVDADGAIVAAAGDLAGRAGQLSAHAPALASAADADAEGSYVVDGVTRRFRVEPVAGTPWRLLAVSPDATQYGLVSELGRAQGVVLALLAACSVWLIRLLLVAHRRSEQLASAAGTDPLTGVANRRGLDRWAEALNPMSPVAAVVVDLDHFKAVNDLFGHGVGDEVLVACAQRLRGVVRSGDEVVRWGGEEFAAVLRGLDAEGARQTAERFRAALADPIATSAGPLDVTASVGCAAGTVATLDDTIRCADVALYEAKQSGRDRVVVGAP